MFFKKNAQKDDYKVLYTNARIIDPLTKMDIRGDLLTYGAKIASYSANAIGVVADEVIDCKGNILMPGIIDIHVHLRDPGYTNKEDIESGTKSAAAGGITTVVCQPNTNPKIEDIVVLSYVQKKAADVAYVNVEVYGAITKNQNSLTDMYSLQKAGVVGFTDDGLPVMDSNLMKQAMLYSSMFDIHIAQHAEDLTLTNCGCMNEGPISHELNVPGIPSSSEAIIVARDLILLESIPNAKYHLLHVSSKRAMELIIDAKKKKLNVTCEVTPHHLLLTEEALRGYNTLAKVNPPLKNEEDRKYLIKALQDGYIDVIASDHAPHDNDSKQLPISQASFGMVGLETMLPLSLELYHSGVMTLHDLLAKLTCNPAAIIKSKAGIIKEGAIADLIILDLNKECIIDKNNFSGKSNNTPFHGRKVKGEILRTIVMGQTVFIKQY